VSDAIDAVADQRGAGEGRSSSGAVDRAVAANMTIEPELERPQVKIITEEVVRRQLQREARPTRQAEGRRPVATRSMCSAVFEHLGYGLTVRPLLGRRNPA
jgi:hypothetical protein